MQWTIEYLILSFIRIKRHKYHFMFVLLWMLNDEIVYTFFLYLELWFAIMFVDLLIVDQFLDVDASLALLPD